MYILKVTNRYVMLLITYSVILRSCSIRTLPIVWRITLHRRILDNRLAERISEPEITDSTPWSFIRVIRFHRIFLFIWPQSWSAENVRIIVITVVIGLGHFVGCQHHLHFTDPVANLFRKKTQYRWTSLYATYRDSKNRLAYNKFAYKKSKMTVS